MAMRRSLAVAPCSTLDSAAEAVVSQATSARKCSLREDQANAGAGPVVHYRPEKRRKFRYLGARESILISPAWQALSKWDKATSLGEVKVSRFPRAR